MSDNPYSAPTSQVSDEHQIEENGSTERFFAVSPKKFIVMHITTLGIYFFYWNYKNWKREREVTGGSIMPFWRAVFRIFFTHSLFRKISEVASRRDVQVSWSHGTYATIIVVLLIVDRVAERISFNTETIGILDMVSFLILFVVIPLIVPIQKTINQINNDPEGDLNSRFTVANYICMLLGGLLWLFVFVGIFADELFMLEG